MRQIINGKVYDTETSEELYRSSEGEGFHWLDWAMLYRSPNGQFFCYSKNHHDNDPDFQLIQDNKVKRWLLQYNCTDPKVYEKLGFILEEA